MTQSDPVTVVTESEVFSRNLLPHACWRVWTSGASSVTSVTPFFWNRFHGALADEWAADQGALQYQASFCGAGLSAPV